MKREHRNGYEHAPKARQAKAKWRDHHAYNEMLKEQNRKQEGMRETRFSHQHHKTWRQCMA